MVGVASLELLDEGVLGQCCTIQLQLGVPSWMVHVDRILSLPAFHRGGPPSVLSCLLLLGIFLRDQLPFLGRLFLFPFLLQVWDGEQADCGRWRGGSAGGSWDPEASLGPTSYPSGGRTILSFCCPMASRLSLQGRCQHMQR